MLVDSRFSHLGIVTNGDERLQEKKGGIMLPKKREISFYGKKRERLTMQDRVLLSIRRHLF